MRLILWLPALVILLAAATGAAQESQVSIRYVGWSFFLITAPDGTRVAIDPYGQIGYPMTAVDADVLLITHEHGDHNNAALVQGARHVFRGLTADRMAWNRIYERIGGVLIKVVPSFHDNEAGTSPRGLNAIFVVETGGLRVVHLGDLGQAVLTDGQVRAIGAVDVLMIPVGAGPFTITPAQATAVAAQLRPRITIPMHYKTPLRQPANWPGVDEQPFIAGKPNVMRAGNTLQLSAGQLPASTQIVVMDGR